MIESNIENRYIIAMELGNSNDITGINYNQLIAEMNNRMLKPFTQEGEVTFMLWFLENFSSIEVLDVKPSSLPYFIEFVKRKYGLKLNPNRNELIDKFADKYLNVPSFLNGDASKKYLDYLELKDSRKASRQAMKKANQSIYIAIGALIITIIFSIIEMTSSPKEPIKTEITNLESLTPMYNQQKTIDSLKNEIYKAEVLIAIYEGDSLNQYGKVIKTN